MLVAGQIVDRYVVEALVGQGGMAMVYRVRHSQLGSLHALKLLNLMKPHIQERLLLEGRAQAVIRHPNVVSVTDVLDVGGTPGLVMEYVEGPSLEMFLKRHRPTMSEIDSIFRGICMGVSVAHSRGLVHRDLKPANVLLAPIENVHSIGEFPWTPKVTDFGIAKLLDSDQGDDTRTNMAMGTPHYMAPEQIRDAKRVDARADIFSLGCLLYELACGTKAFDGSDVLEIMNSVATGKYLPARRMDPDLPDRVVLAIEGALRVDRENRIPDCASLLEVYSGNTTSGVERSTPSERTFPSESGVDLGSSTDPVGIGPEERATPAIVQAAGPPADPNAATVPAVTRSEVPTVEGITSRSWLLSAIAAFALALVAGLSLVVIGTLVEDPAADSIDVEPEIVMGAATDVPNPDIAPPNLPAPEEPKKSPTKRPASGESTGLGLFGAAPPATTVTVLGARKSVLLARGVQVPPGTVAPGRYLVRAWVTGIGDPFEILVDAAPGQELTVGCTKEGCAVVP